MLMYFAQLALKDKGMKKLVASLKKSGMQVTLTSKGHIRVYNTSTGRQVVVSSGRTKNRRTILEIHRDLRSIGYDAREDKNG